MDLVNAREAARILGVSPSSVSRMKRDGLLPHVPHGRGERFERQVVLDVKKDRERGYKTRDMKAELTRQRYEMESLKRQVRMLMLRQGLQIQPPLSDQDLMALYVRAEQLPAHVDLDNARDWLESALRVTETDFTKLAALTGDPDPWARFFRYGEDLLVKLQGRHDYPKKPEVIQLVLELMSLQQDIRKSAIVWIETRPERVSSTEKFDARTSTDNGPVDPDALADEMAEDNL